MSYSDNGGKLVWGSQDIFAKHLVESFHVPIDRLSVAIGGGNGENAYPEYARLILGLWRYIRPIYVKVRGKAPQEEIKALDDTLKEVFEIVAKLYSPNTPLSTKKELQSRFVFLTDNALNSLYAIETQIQIFVPINDTDIGNLTEEEYWTGISKIKWEGEKREENNPG